jgi:hypothetical protein
VVPEAPRSESPSPAGGGWPPPLFSGRLASGKLLVLGPTRLKRTTLGGPPSSLVRPPAVPPLSASKQVKFYTRERYAAMQGEPGVRRWLAARRWDRAAREYARHLASITSRLPPSVLEFSALSLHDGQVKSVARADKDTLILHFEGRGYWGPNQAKVGDFAAKATGAPGTVGIVLPRLEPSALDVTFSGVCLVEGLEEIVGGWWLYDELHAADDGAFDFQVLLDRSEFRIVARDVAAASAEVRPA